MRPPAVHATRRTGRTTATGPSPNATASLKRCAHSMFAPGR